LARFGDEIDTSKFSKLEDVYQLVNMAILNCSVYVFIWLMISKLRRVYIENLRNNKSQKEINWMMSRTLEINGRFIV
jgi:hypothetical protein